ncbi:MAG: hypothetical protein OEU09_11920 [Rhodospirillales bacterium]|nr:hypothetical protein [Rhodospirillales bacterium]MDH3791863.1 hypothetical protein [Rhodospirillales bacterium]MDH3911995.1 hypothetical protein [Rhodospirillales bacterium]MDH3965909.1 hypothetical protein [Rhodospirillales bacterium]
MFVRTIFLAAAALALQVTAASAGQCPLDIKKIDAALAASPQLSAAQLDEVKTLRKTGADQHKSGQHKQSVETLHKAKAILGVN